MNLGVGTPLATVFALFTSLRLAGFYLAAIILHFLEIIALCVALLYKWKSIFSSMEPEVVLNDEE